MPRNCTICNHPQLKEITHALIARRPYRSIQARYGVNKSSIVRHLKRHVTKALRQLSKTEMPIAQAAEIGEPVLVEMRRLNQRSLKILKAAEEAKDHTLALHAVRECRRNLELIAKLTGELDPRAAGEETGGGALQVTVIYSEKAAVQVSPPEAPVSAPAALLEAACPR